MQTIEAGAINHIPVPLLLYRCYRNHYTGMVSFTRGNITRKVYFDHGAIIFAESNCRIEQFSKFLIRQDRLTEEEVELAEKFAVDANLLLTEAIFRQGLIGIDELKSLANKYASTLIYSLFEWTSGNYNSEPN